MRKIISIIVSTSLLIACQSTKDEFVDVKNIENSTIVKVNQLLGDKYPDQNLKIERGVTQTANLWRQSNGNHEDFEEFCVQNYISDETERELVFHKISRNLEALLGRFNQLSITLLEPLHLNIGEIHKIDHMFGAYNVGAHLWDDFYKNKIAFVVALNYPNYSLEQKNELGEKWSRKEWAYARMGDLFIARVPASLMQSMNDVSTKADSYIADYNIYMGNLLTENQQTLFPSDMKLLSHWNLRDEIKSNYADINIGIVKQRMIYQVMQRIVDQTIPYEVVNNDKYEWNPYSNETYENGKPIQINPEPNLRYQHILNYFHEYQKQDKYYTQKDTYIKRAFEEGMEISQAEVERLFVEYVSSPLAKEVGDLIASRLGRNLEPFDIWYDGFKSRSALNQDDLDKQTKTQYPNAAAFNADLPNMLKTLGFSSDKAKYLSDKIVVDPARGSGHAWGASMKGDVAHLRTRIGADGMDYKGFNIAVHEFGHNVEQTISLYDVDYYMLKGVPNTAFTEALAFMFQKRDLQILKINNSNENTIHLNTLDQFWSMYEIMGVSLVDMQVWKFLYENPNTTAEQLKNKVLAISKEVWNLYYAPVFGVKDQTILGIYSHMIASPLYLSAYPFGLLIDFQLEQFIADKDFSSEVQRIFELGRLTPNAWMHEAVGAKIGLNPIFRATKSALEKVK
ncbi:MAG: hypothetical protein PHU27_06755 [Salinivirgaceae bacterium]|nr:hypothetical protein [Salinivirgaceae bacterium]MDD4745727.1 hypothetical protein [Salinivirgaceae bacterium]